MRRILGALMVAVTLTGAALMAQARAEQKARNLMQDVTTVGCVRAWKPAPGDPAKLPENREPGVAGIFLLTPLASNPTTATDLPTYLLTPSATINFRGHVDHKVEVTGTAQTAPLPPTVQEIATAPAARPENRPSTESMPRLTVTSLKMVSESCP